MKILFSMRHPGFIRLFEAPLRRLSDRGHRIHLAFDRGELLGWMETVDQLVKEQPFISHGPSGTGDTHEWFHFKHQLHLMIDYLRFLDPLYDTMPHLRARRRELYPEMVLRLCELPGLRTPGGRRLLLRLLELAEWAAPVSPEVIDFLREQRPDLVLLTPLIFLGSPQLEILLAARILGLRTALCVGSWDHLSSKGFIRHWPDRVLVWNGVQKGEAIRMHGLPEDRVVVTGAQCFDQWFDRTPSRSREAFLGSLGLRADRPLLLWVGSAPLFRGSPPEADLVARWIELVRSSPDPKVREAGILVRPHPTPIKEWERIDPKRWAHVAFLGGIPHAAASKNDYFDSLHYSAAVVGLNTTAFIEAAIAERPVLTLLLPEYRENQEGTLHFRYLLDGEEGLLTAARSMDEHLAHLAGLLNGDLQWRSRTRRFVGRFVRPHGLQVESTSVFVEAIERQGREASPGLPARRLDRLPVRALLYPVAAVLDRYYARERQRRRSRTLAERRRRALAGRPQRRPGKMLKRVRNLAGRVERMVQGKWGPLDLVIGRLRERTGGRAGAALP